MFRPMLADNKIPTMDQIKFPVFISPKLDGIRATVQNGALYSRSLKLIPNVQVQKKFKGLPEGLDGELILGDPTDDPYRRTESCVMRHDEDATMVSFHLFDWMFSEKAEFRERYQNVVSTVHMFHARFDIFLVEHFMCHTLDTLEMTEENFLRAGYEGAMLNDPHGLYKQGRSTIREGKLLKLKRFVDAEAEIIAYAEEMENTNEATINALGKTERSSHLAGMVGKNTLGALIVKGVNGKHKDLEFRIGGGFTAQMKRDIWAKREELLGKIVTYKSFPIGNYDLPRMPIFKGFRTKEDM